MNYTLMPSLEHFALIKTVTTLWNPDDIRDLTTDYFSKLDWNAEENCMIEKVKKLPLPESLKKKVLCFITPISNEIRKWINHHIYFYDRKTIGLSSVVRKSLSKLCWTPQGTIDAKKTAERLTGDDDLDIKKRYKLACVYCLEDDILVLWNKMPEDCKKTFYDGKDPRVVEHPPLDVFWTYDIKGEVTRMHYLFEEQWHGCTPYQYAFDYAVSNGNKPATEYFLQKLTSEEREESFERSVHPNKETLCYLLSQMNEVQQEEMLRKDPLSVLTCLLKWPLQGLFVEVAKHVCTDPEIDFFFLLTQIIKKVDDGFKDYNYQKLTTEFWQLIPMTEKECLIHNSNIAFILRRLLKIKDIQNFKLILKDVAITDRTKVIFSDDGIHICKKLIYANEMDLLEFFVKECISSKDLMIKFREKLERYMLAHLKKTSCYDSRKALKRKKDLLNKAFRLLNDFIQEFDKRRCVEEGNNCPVKRLCSLTSE